MMIKNCKISQQPTANALIASVKWLFKKLLSLLIPQGNVIIFESQPEFTDNTYPVYLELRRLLPDYKFVWFLWQQNRFAGKENDVICVEKWTLSGKIKSVFYMSRCKAIVHCNFCQKKYKHSQLSVFLCHGVGFKNLKGWYSKFKPYVDYVNVPSKYFESYMTNILGFDSEQCIYMGYPRCDYFYAEAKRKEINEIVNGKYIIWLPTFRIYKSRTRDDAPGSVFNHIGVPLFYDIQSLRDFNEFLREQNIHIVYKPHFAQDMDIVKRETLSNFHMIYDADILGRNLQLYEVIAQSEALITDYSSVFWDYLLLDRPIALTVDDVESYRKGMGFAVDFDLISSETSERLCDSKSLREFIMNVINGNDIMSEGRRKWRDIANMHQDGKSAERTAEFIKSMLE